MADVFVSYARSDKERVAPLVAAIEAYNLYLMARQFSVTGNYGNVRRCEAIIRLCRSATEIDPDYATAWALMAVAQAALKFYFNGAGDGGLSAAERRSRWTRISATRAPRRLAC